MKVREYADGDSLWRVACDCGDQNHDAQLWFETIDKDHEDISLCLGMEVGFYPRDGWWYNLGRRIGAASKMLFTGYYTSNGEVILDEAGIKAMQEALKKGLAHQAKVKADWDRKKKERDEKKNAEIGK